jgi:hypothetical protein
MRTLNRKLTGTQICSLECHIIRTEVRQIISKTTPMMLENKLSASTSGWGLFGRSEMGAKHCTGALSAIESQRLGEELDLRLHTCAACGRRNLYPIRDRLKNWELEPHLMPMGRPDGMRRCEAGQARRSTKATLRAWIPVPAIQVRRF